MRGMGSHQSAYMLNDEWLTPRDIIAALGPFDLDPCAARSDPHRCAPKGFTVDDDGLNQPWHGLVWVNPPYGRNTAPWLDTLVRYGNGIALIFARTETKMFHDYVWDAANCLLFLRGRLHFHYPNGTRAAANAGAPSVLIGYGDTAHARLRRAGALGKIEGKFLVL